MAFTRKDEREADFVVVGAGSAGCVIANRLSADPGNRVLLVEAGPAGHALSTVPVSFGAFIAHPRVNWCYHSEPEASTGGRPIPVPRGKIVGGSSAINGLVYVRGQRLDYDTWAQLGNRGWSYDDVLPLFRRLEHYEPGPIGSRGQGGPIHVSVTPDESPLYDALFAACEEVGLARNDDYNGADQEGVAKTQTTIRHGRRVSAADGYLRPARGRANLRILSSTLARKVIVERGRCRGVELENKGRVWRVEARREVVLCAGAINSPQLLELSGIGDPAVLEPLGIELAHRLDGVGENLRDHYSPRMVIRIARAKVTYNDRARGAGLLWQALRYAFTRRGFFSLPSAPLLVFLKSRAGLAAPDVQLHLSAYALADIRTRTLMRDSGMMLTVSQLRPESTGSVHLRSADPGAPPRILFNFLAAALDGETLVAGLRRAREIVAARAMDAFRGEELRPGRHVAGDAELIEWIKGNAQTTYHPVGTCKMGTDAAAVVDHELKVHGLEGLRVADGSIMPTLVSGNTNAACLMIGEKASDLILGAQ